MPAPWISVVAGKKGSILMVEAGSQELSEELMLEALSLAQKQNRSAVATISWNS